MAEHSYWLLRCENQFFVVDGGHSGKTFPLGLAGDFGDPATALRIGDWQGRACFAAEIAQPPARIAGELSLLRPLYGLAGAEAFALAGRVDIDFQTEPLGTDRSGNPVFLKDLWPSSGEIAEAVAKSRNPEAYRELYTITPDKNPRWAAVHAPSSTRRAGSLVACRRAGKEAAISSMGQ